jgi:hypothetical protein
MLMQALMKAVQRLRSIEGLEAPGQVRIINPLRQKTRLLADSRRCRSDGPLFSDCG